jgi:hypothetical protein
MARHLAFIAVGEIVVIGQFLTGRDVLHGTQVDTFIFFRGFAVGFARMIYQRAMSMPSITVWPSARTKR